jgi:osmotically-inducible protein OsmY
MERSYLLLALAWVSASCGGAPSTQAPEPPRQAVEAAMVPLETRGSGSTIAPESDADRDIRQRLNVAIRHDGELRHREISFLVSNGDVSVTGIVRSEDERTRLNELAMNTAGVKSIANALRIAE